ncbi:MAG: hypothetical protein NUV77_24375 [Thermoguttaceae bacterium]|jgi:hypothetical protein|nr:hypothetical protein [Thermoguttaceae bacterium]
MSARSLLLVCLWFPSAAAGLLAAPVELEVFTDERVPITGRQEWLRRLSEVGVSNLRIRAKQADDKVGIEVRGTGADRVCVVTGMLDSKNELVLPGGRYSLNQAAAAARWLRTAGERGQDKPSEQAAFGLSAQQLERVRKELAAPLERSTRGKDRAEVARQIVAGLALPARMDASALETMQGNTVAEELTGLSVGTALAAVLRPAGLCFVPRAGASGRGEIAVVHLRDAREAWPVGWPPEKPVPEVIPTLFESFNANIDNVPVDRVLDALGQRLKVPILCDRHAMARHGVDAGKATVRSPKSRTTYHNLLRKVLSQARLTYEVRVDEAGQPFVWVTTMKP